MLRGREFIRHDGAGDGSADGGPATGEPNIVDDGERPRSDPSGNYKMLMCDLDNVLCLR